MAKVVRGTRITGAQRETLKEDLSSLALPLSQLVIFLVIAVVVGVLAAVIPSIRASRMNVLEAIAEE